MWTMQNKLCIKQCFFFVCFFCSSWFYAKCEHLPSKDVNVLAKVATHVYHVQMTTLTCHWQG